MSDFALLEQDGWAELEPEELAAAVDEHTLDVDELWRAVGAGDHAAAAQALELAGWEGLGGVEVAAVIVPDDVEGERLRVFVRDA